MFDVEYKVDGVTPEFASKAIDGFHFGGVTMIAIGLLFGLVVAGVIYFAWIIKPKLNTIRPRNTTTKQPKRKVRL